MKIRQWYFNWILVLLGGGLVVGLHADEEGGQAGAFLRYGVGSRALGMGRSFIAVSNDASAVYWNPAGVVSVPQMEMATMYSNLYFDSQFTYMGFVVPRPFSKVHNKTMRFFLGPHSGLGMGWIGLGMVGFEQRTPTGEFLGHFGFQENAFLLSWAREEVGRWGIFQWGLTGKLISQNFSGMASTPEIEKNGEDWTGGLDVGILFQPIHAPIFKAFSLRYILPLRLALTIQNCLSPAWEANNGTQKAFPRVLRWGMSYQWVLQDWIPATWQKVRSILKDSQILTSVDWEYYHSANTGIFFGMEGIFPLAGHRVYWFPRFGINNRTDRFALGTGIHVPFAHTSALRVEYAYTVHPDLPNDASFMVSFRTGASRGVSFFKTLFDRQPELGVEPLLNMISQYPHEEINGTVKILAELDPKNSERYHHLLGGLDRAEWLYRNAIEWLYQNEPEKAKRKASEAIREYGPLFGQTENPLGDLELGHYAEMLLLLNENKAASQVLMEVEKPSIRFYYLSGMVYKGLGQWDLAITHFDSVLSVSKREAPMLQSMECLASLGLAECWMKKNQYASAIKILNRLVENRQARLESDYPRFPIFKDERYVDDAQFLMGLCKILNGKIEEGISTLLEVDRFYPNLEYGQMVRGISEQFIGYLKTNDIESLNRLVQNLLEVYSKTHGLMVD